METDLKFMDQSNIVYYSINLHCSQDEKGNWISNKEYPDRLKKFLMTFPNIRTLF